MVRRLVLDAVWRGRHFNLMMFASLGLLWTIQAGIDESARFALALSLAVAFIAALLSVAFVGQREVRVLPVTNRDLWVTSWILSAVVVPVAITAVQSLAVAAVRMFTGSSAVSTDALWLASLYCFAYAGALLPLGPVMGYAGNNIGSRRPRWLWIGLTTVSILLMVGALGLPFYFTKFLPLSIDQVSAGTIVAVAGCLAIAGLSFFWTPRRGGVPRVAGTASSEPRSQTGSQPRFVDGLTGVSRFAWPYVTVVLLVVSGILAAFIAYWVMFDSTVPLRTFLAGNALLIFETGFLPRTDPGSMWVTVAIATIATSSPWKSLVRPLKVLPIATHQLNALVLLTPFVQWASIWLVLLATHLAVVGSLPGTLRPDVFVFAGGVSALGHVLMLRFGHKGGMSIIILVALRPLAERLSLPVGTILLVTGLMALGLAAFINHRTLTRSTSSSRIFQPDSLPFGINAPNAQR
jgi:hypothetical protein